MSNKKGKKDIVVEKRSKQVYIDHTKYGILEGSINDDKDHGEFVKFKLKNSIKGTLGDWDKGEIILFAKKNFKIITKKDALSTIYESGDDD